MHTVLPFIAAFIFWGCLWLGYSVVIDYIVCRYKMYKHQKWATNHFKETERFQRGLDY